MSIERKKKKKKENHNGKHRNTVVLLISSALNVVERQKGTGCGNKTWKNRSAPVTVGPFPYFLLSLSSSSSHLLLDTRRLCSPLLCLSSLSSLFLGSACSVIAIVFSTFLFTHTLSCLLAKALLLPRATNLPKGSPYVVPFLGFFWSLIITIA